MRSENLVAGSDVDLKGVNIRGHRWTGWRRIWLLPILIAPVLLVVCLCSYRNDPIGGSGASCDNWELEPVKSGSGWIATGHTTACTTFGTDIATYVFVHKEHEADDRSNMVLRYFQSFETKGPFISWRGPNEVAIEIAAPVAITKSLNQVDSVRVRLTVRP